jgi:hypothetical protein
MQLHIIIIIIIIQLLFIAYKHVQTMSIIHTPFLSTEYPDKKNESKPKFHISTCISDSDCHLHGWCQDGNCKCEKGWITWCNSRQCSYEQSSKILAFILSFIVGCAGIDWFFLSRKDSLYILCGILKLLISTGCCIWSPLAARSKSKSAMTAASCLSVSLTLISFIWWFVDWIRILFNSFPDGNGASLV